MSKIGVLFDIDELGGGLYGYAAYTVFFQAIDTRQLGGCSLSDGDTFATLRGSTRQYCIALESFDTSKIAAVRKALSASNAKGLLPLSSRFLEDAQVNREPLVAAARIDRNGDVVDCETGWAMDAWTAVREQIQSSASNEPAEAGVAENTSQEQPEAQTSVSPTSAVVGTEVAQTQSYGGMSLWHTLFRFTGRISRETLWKFWLLCACVWFLLFVVVSGLNQNTRNSGAQSSCLVPVAFLILVWVTLAVQAKRLHDRDYSGWWQLVVLIPFLGAIWLFIVLGFLPGTPGPNKYGERADSMEPPKKMTETPPKPNETADSLEPRADDRNVRPA